MVRKKQHLGWSQGISESAPHIALLPARVRHATVSIILRILRIITVIDHFVPLATVARFVFPPEEDDVREGAQPAEGDVREHDAVAKTVPRLVPCAVLPGVGCVRAGSRSADASRTRQGNWLTYDVGGHRSVEVAAEVRYDDSSAPCCVTGNSGVRRGREIDLQPDGHA